MNRKQGTDWLASFQCNATVPWDAELQSSPFPQARSSLRPYGWDSYVAYGLWCAIRRYSYVGITFTGGTWTQTEDWHSKHMDIQISHRCVQPESSAQTVEAQPSYRHCRVFIMGGTDCIGDNGATFSSAARYASSSMVNICIHASRSAREHRGGSAVASVGLGRADWRLL